MARNLVARRRENSIYGPFLDTSRFQRARALFERLSHLPNEERERELDLACGDDLALRDEVATLLTFHDNAKKGELTGAGPALSENLRDEPASQQMPDRIGPYQVIELLGRGGMGTVYLVEQTRPIQRQLALKLVVGGRSHPEFLRRFEFERQALALMNHPDIARVIDAGVDQAGDPYFAMEFVRGKGLLEYCESEQISTPGKLELFLRVCDAVQHAHQKGIVHRDLKPSNILVGGDEGQVVLKVIDFGIAKALEHLPGDPRTSTALHQVVGTVDFMSPEQASGQSAAIDTRSDVYSLGVILFRLLSGEMPHDLEGLTLAAALRVVAETPAFMPGGLDPDLKAILGQSLELDPDDRYSTVEALAEDLRRFQDGHTVRARKTTTAYQLRKLYQRHRGRFAVGVAGLVFLLGAIVVISSMYQRQRELRTEARLEADLAKQTTTFLHRMLASTGQDSLGHDVTVREILDLGAQDLESDPEYRGQLKAEALSLLGDSYKDIGLFAEAIEHFRKSLAEWSTVDEIVPDEVVATQVKLANTLVDWGQSDEALTVSREAVELALDRLPPGSPIRRLALTSYSSKLRISGSLEESEALLRQILEDEVEDNAEPSFDVLNQLGLVLGQQGKSAESVQIGRLLADMTYDGSGPLRNPWGLVNLAAWLENDDQLDEAETTLAPVLEAMDELLSETDPRRAGILNIQAIVRLQLGAVEEADSILGLALTYYGYQAANHNRALVPLYRGHFDEAEERFRSWVDLHEPEKTASFVSRHLGWAQLGLGKTEEARQSFEWAARAPDSEGETRHPRRGLALQALASCLLDQGRPEAALEAATDASLQFEGFLRDGHIHSELAAHTLATCRSFVQPTAASDSTLRAGLPRLLQSDKLVPICRSQRLRQAREALAHRGLAAPVVDGYGFAEAERRP